MGNLTIVRRLLGIPAKRSEMLSLDDEDTGKSL